MCEKCWLVQTEDYAQESKLFTSTYAYFSSFSSTWLAHCEDYVAAMTDRFSLSAKSLVCEVAANDGYLLQYFKKRRIPCFGIEPTKSTALAAQPASAQVRMASGVDAGELDVPINKSQVLRADRPYSKALIGNPDIADIVPISSTSVYVLGKKTGTTSLTLYDRANRLIAVGTWSSGIPGLVSSAAATPPTGGRAPMCRSAPCPAARCRSGPRSS